MKQEAPSPRIGRGVTVHHPDHGIGHVQKVGKRKFAGNGGGEFAQLYFRRERLTLIVPAQDLAGTVRKPLNARQAGELLDYLKKWNGPVSKQWKARAAAHQEAIERGDPFACAEVCKGLSLLESTGSLRQTDRMHLNRSFDLLADELAHALDETPDHARTLIADALGGQTAD